MFDLCISNTRQNSHAIAELSRQLFGFDVELPADANPVSLKWKHLYFTISQSQQPYMSESLDSVFAGEAGKHKREFPPMYVLQLTDDEQFSKGDPLWQPVSDHGLFFFFSSKMRWPKR